MHKKADGTSWYSIYPLNKKIFLLSKILMGICLVSYLISSKFIDWGGDLFFIGSLLVLILGWDAVLVKILSQPMQEISETAQRMAELDFSQPCVVETKDELQTLAENLNTTAENLEQALAQRKELSDSLSHELKTPLGVIRAYVEGLEHVQKDQQEAYRQIIIEETEKMTDLINALLDLSSLEAGAGTLQVERFDLVELVETVAGREFVDIPVKPFKFTYLLPDEPIYIAGDQNRLRQVLHNFMNNAKKFVPSDGKIHLKVEALTGKVRFSIYNDGPNLSEDVWEKFQRDKQEINRVGSGLGLSIAAQILTMHQADYGFINHKEGVEFYCSFSAIS
ncbi:HAMP domain-containing sensor histidine kinase [Enterococcus sp. AZ109]|uniref:HAMP domain-containing sensor histidine kinase n=1 Tax=Enterococcus sp. AZ109 TaxID=2774634 RepID=UPI003F208F7B